MILCNVLIVKNNCGCLQAVPANSRNSEYKLQFVLFKSKLIQLIVLLSFDGIKKGPLKELASYYKLLSVIGMLGLCGNPFCRHNQPCCHCHYRCHHHIFPVRYQTWLSVGPVSASGMQCIKVLINSGVLHIYLLFSFVCLTLVNIFTFIICKFIGYGLTLRGGDLWYISSLQVTTYKGKGS